MDWDRFRNPDGTIDLVEAYISLNWHYEVKGPIVKPSNDHNKIKYLRRIMSLQPIKSRQAAAIAIASAMENKCS